MAADDLLIIGGVGLLAYGLYSWYTSQTATVASTTTPTGINPTIAPNIAQPNVSALLTAGTQAMGGTVTTPSSNAFNFIKQWETLQLKPYNDAGHTAIGYGHDFQAGETVPSSITQSQANAYLQSDVANVSNAINSYVTVPLNQNQYDALTDLVYDIGTGAFASSTLLSLLNQGSYAGAAAQFGRWIYSQNVVSQNLINRRAAETALFNTAVA